MNDVTTPDLSIDEIMLRIREELSNRTAQATTAPRAPATSAPPAKLLVVGRPSARLVAVSELRLPDPVQLVLPACDTVELATLRPKGNTPYHVNELLCFEDVAFVEAAYRAVFERKVDSDGLHCYLTMLRDGASKFEILGRLCASAEGRQRNAHLVGITRPYLLDRLSRWPVVGSVCRLAAVIWNLPNGERRYRRLANEMAQRTARTTQRIDQAVTAIHVALRALRDSQNLQSQARRSFVTRAQLAALQETLAAAVSSIDALKVGLASKIDAERLEARASEMHRQLEAKAQEIGGQLDGKAEKAAVAAMEQKVHSALHTKAEWDELERRSAHLATTIRAIGDGKADVADVAALRRTMEILTRELGSLAGVKGDLTTLRNGHQLLLRGMETKIDRHELTGLANHLLTLLQQRVTAEDLQRVAQSIESANDSIATLRGSLPELRATVESQIANALNDVNRRMQTLADTKVAEPALAATNAEVQTLMEKVARAEISLRDAVTEIVQRLDIGLALKADRETTADIVQRLDASLALKADRNALERLDAVAGESLAAAISKVTDSLRSLADSKADRVQVEAVKSESARAIAQTNQQLKDALSCALAPLSSQARDLKHNVLDQERRIRLLLEEARKRLPKPISTKQLEAMVAEEDHLLDAMYASFEDQFRGTRADIRNRVSVYLPHIREASAGTAKAPVLDLGCGRGEWLELLKDEGLTARGVDLNRVFIKGCQDLGLDVFEEDALAFLRDLRPNSLGAVTSFHLIEHLPHRYLISVVDEILRVLRPGGIVILETPNPRNLRVGACDFYLDPTHRNPLPPDLSRYVLEARGFVNIEIKELHPLPAESQIVEGAATVRDFLNRTFFSEQDYAVIGRKS